MKQTHVIIVTGLVLALGGCRDLGLPGNVPEEQSRTQPPPDLVREVTTLPDDTPGRLVVDGRLWVPTGRPTALTGGQLRPVGSAAGQTVYARAWDDRPYRAIFTAVDMPAAADAATARDAMAAGQEHWQEYAPVLGQSGGSAGTDRMRHDLIREAPPSPLD
jgi:hypothetical protein